MACAGAEFANHAEFVSVPKNLVVKILDNVSSEEAAFTTIGSNCSSGVRLANPKIGKHISNWNGFNRSNSLPNS